MAAPPVPSEQVCRGELAADYWHCLGCEWHFERDWNVCGPCRAAHAFGRDSGRHTGGSRGCLRELPTLATQRSLSSASRDLLLCECTSATRPPGPLCNVCGTCTACRCYCHAMFQPRSRFVTRDFMASLAGALQAAAAGAPASAMPSLGSGLIGPWESEPDWDVAGSYNALVGDAALLHPLDMLASGRGRPARRGRPAGRGRLVERPTRLRRDAAAAVPEESSAAPLAGQYGTRFSSRHRPEVLPATSAAADMPATSLVCLSGALARTLSNEAPSAAAVMPGAKRARCTSETPGDPLAVSGTAAAVKVEVHSPSRHNGKLARRLRQLGKAETYKLPVDAQASPLSDWDEMGGSVYGAAAPGGGVAALRNARRASGRQIAVAASRSLRSSEKRASAVATPPPRGAAQGGARTSLRKLGAHAPSAPPPPAAATTPCDVAPPPSQDTRSKRIRRHNSEAELADLLDVAVRVSPPGPRRAPPQS